MSADHDSEALRVKRAFYDSFNFLTDDTDEVPDLGLGGSRNALHGRQPADNLAMAMSSGRMYKQSSVTPAEAAAEHASLSRSVSETHLNARAKSTVPPRSTAPVIVREPSLSTRHTFSGALPALSTTSTMTGKLKRDSKTSTVPDDQQIFRGLQFYFFPNNDKNPARRMRIAKATEYGATWVRDFDESVTHILVDRLMDHAMLTKFLKLETLPTRVVLVTEKWQSDCIAWKALLNPMQDQFLAFGAPTTGRQTETMPQAPVPPTDSDESLELKPAGKGVIARPRTTPLSRTQSQASERPDVEDSTALPTEDRRIRSAEHQPPLQDPVQSQTRVPDHTYETTDELEEAIEKARDLQLVPLDDEDGDSRPSSSDGADDPGGRKLKTMQDRFQCMQAHKGETDGSPNAPTIAILQQMAHYYGQVGDEWRVRAYRKAMATLRNLAHEVSTKEEAMSLPNIGERLASKIEEIVFTNRLRRLDSARAEPRDQVLQTFMQIYGVGFVQASQWVREGYTTIDEVRDKAKLTKNQQIGIDHYEDFLIRIPRAEVEEHGAIVRKAFQGIDKNFTVEIGGSYRRGAASSGDIDCIVSHPDRDIKYISSVMVERLVPQLTKAGFLTAALAVTSKDDGTKWHGASCLPGAKIWRRIDFMLVPPEELGAAMIAFTGNDIFNRSLRLLASSKGMRLSQRGLYKGVMRGKGREKLSEGELVEGRDEKRIFKVLGVTWRPPEHRVV